MKKLLIIFMVLISPYLFFLLLRFINCRVDKSVYEVSRPLAEAVVKHVQKHGRPKELSEVENLPYILKPCSKKPKEFFCKDYFFEKNGKYYTAHLSGSLPKGRKVWMDLEVEHRETGNTYKIIRGNKITDPVELTPHVARYSTGICKNFSF